MTSIIERMPEILAATTAPVLEGLNAAQGEEPRLVFIAQQTGFYEGKNAGGSDEPAEATDVS